jgi:hypothetical protein
MKDYDAYNSPGSYFAVACRFHRSLCPRTTRDVQRFCRPVIDQGDLVILSCLQQNRAKITPACDQVLKSHGQ